jgi:hypothetical protein
MVPKCGNDQESSLCPSGTCALIENGFVYIPETASWLAEYLHELTVFPKGRHDDQADSTAQFLDWFKRPFPGQGIFELYRQLAEEAEQRRGQQTT